MKTLSEEKLTQLPYLAICFCSSMGLTFRMEFLVILTILLSLLACQAKIEDASSSLSSTLSYWNHKLPNTPFPTALLGRLSTLEANRLAYPNHTRNKTEASLPFARIFYKAFNRKGQMTTEPSGTIYFLEKILGIGKKVTVDLALWKNPETLYFIPAVVANEIPFSTKSLSVSLDKLHIPQDSILAVTMKETLEECDRSVMIGESKKCVTSLESMIDYTTSELGTNDVNVSITNVSKITTSGKKQYTIASIPFESKSTSALVVCHTIEYAYLVYFCHNIKDTRMFQLSLKSDEGNTAEIVAICHEDTTAWSPEHVSFKMLNVKPGGEAICHFTSEDGIVWVAAN